MKTIYLLNTKQHGGSTVPLAFECEQCAQLQAAWYRRAGVQAQVINVQLHENTRTASRDKCPHLLYEPEKPKGARKVSDPMPCDHIPYTVNGG